ncbi:MAG: hypothetical protein IPO54_09065 [Micavibrio sp.]|nr:hypothetical protein [Micavibrio sp.]
MSILKRIERLARDQSGMTLIDVAVITMVLGLLLVPLITQYNRWKIDKDRGLTSQHYAAINKAIADYYFEQGHYPCPALPTLGPGDAAFGDQNCAGTAAAGGVMVGAVPFATLKIPTEMNLDGWSNKITYAVTAIQTDTATWTNNGVIRVRGRIAPDVDQCDPAIMTLENQVHYLLVSHGPSGLGAFTADGTPRQTCPGAGTTADANNCINDNEFLGEVCMASDNADANFYDDMVEYKKDVPSRIWEESLTASSDIISNAENVGINNLNPQASLHVNGNIRATHTDSNRICAEDGNNCFAAAMIGGTDPLMKCASNPGSTSSAMSGIGEARAKCQSGYTAATIQCEDGKFITQIGSNGGLLCGN